MHENRRRASGYGARAVDTPARLTFWLVVLFVLGGMVWFAYEDARDLYRDADARAKESQSWACDSLPVWARKP